MRLLLSCRFYQPYIKGGDNDRIHSDNIRDYEEIMQIQAEVTGFDEYYPLLQQSNVANSPAEIHGVLCGFVCAGAKLNGGSWIDILLMRLGVRSRLGLGRQGAAVVSLYDVACRQLSGLQTFKLLLPSEKSDLNERAEALSLWCEGFLYGLGFGGDFALLEEELSDTVHEVLVCVAEIARLDMSQLHISEQDNQAYKEAITFITQAIPLIYEELVAFVGANSSMVNSGYLH